MLKDITIGQHYPSNSVIHRLDPRIKLIATFVFMVSLFIINKFWPYAIVFIINKETIKTKVAISFYGFLIYNK